MGLFLVTTPYQPNGISLTVPSLCFPSPSYSDLDRIDHFVVLFAVHLIACWFYVDYGYEDNIFSQLSER